MLLVANSTQSITLSTELASSTEDPGLLRKYLAMTKKAVYRPAAMVVFLLTHGSV